MGSTKHGLCDPTLEKTPKVNVGFAPKRTEPRDSDGAYHIQDGSPQQFAASEENTGDSAGNAPPSRTIHAKVCADIGVTLPEPGTYAVGNVFLPRGCRRNRQKTLAPAPAAEAHPDRLSLGARSGRRRPISAHRTGHDAIHRTGYSRLSRAR